MKDRLWNYRFASLVIINTFTSIGFYMIMTTLSKYLTEEGADIAVAGFITGLFSVTSLIIRPFCGILSDRVNKVKLLLISLILVSIGMFGYSLSAAAAPVIFFRIIHGVGFSIVSTVLIALAALYIPVTRLGEGIGYLGIGQVIASAVAPGLGIVLASLTGYRVVFLAAGGLTVVSVVLLLVLRKNLTDSEAPLKAEKKNTRPQLQNILAADVLGYTFVSGIYSFTNGVITTYLVLYADYKGIAGISMYFTVCAVFLFVSRPLSGRLVDRKGLSYAIYPALILTGTSMFLLGSAGSLVMMLLSGAVRSIGQGTTMPALQAECIRKAGRERSGVATSTYYLGGDIGQGTGPMIGGMLVGLTGYESLFYMCGMMLLSMLIVYYIIRKRENTGR